RFVVVARNCFERGPPAGQGGRRRAELESAQTPAVRLPERPHCVDSPPGEAYGRALRLERCVVEVPRFLRAPPTSPVPRSPAPLDLRRSHPEADVPERVPGNENTLLRQEQRERQCESDHGRTIENPDRVERARMSNVRARWATAEDGTPGTSVPRRRGGLL